jgi:hypothetical protein
MRKGTFAVVFISVLVPLALVNEAGLTRKNGCFTTNALT